MELYIHIPFCIRKCAYCDFLSGPADVPTQEQYMKALLQEVKLAGQRHQQQTEGGIPGSISPIAKNTESGRGERVDTIFIGGGTPSAVDAAWLVRLIEQVRDSFEVAADAEITMEANPGTLTADKLAQYRRAGINRLSIGLQSTDDGELQRLGRIHTYEEFLENYRLARAAGFTNINIDLMSALPGPTTASYERTLRRVIALEPEHISAYSLIIEEGTPFWQLYGDEEEQQDGKNQLQGKAPLPTEDEDRQMYHRTKEILAQAGYERYEISNYAKPGYECRHNVGYWTRVPYLGLGLGAASYYGGQRFVNTRDMEEYLTVLNGERASEEGKQMRHGDAAEAGRSSFSHSDTEEISAALRRDVQRLSEQDAIEEFMFLGLRLTTGVSARVFENSFGQSLTEVYGPVLQKLQKQGLLETTGDGWCLTDLGLDVSNQVLAEFLF